MRLLLDEQLSPRVARKLRDRGHDVASVSERPDLAGLGDAAVLEAAVAEGRAVVSNNVRDFRPLAARAVVEGGGHPGMVLLPGAYRRRQADTGRIVEALDALLSESESEDTLANREVWL